MNIPQVIQEATNPGNTQRIITVPQNTLWKIKGISVLCVNDTDVVTRNITVRFRDGNNTNLLIVTADKDVLASESRENYFYPNMPRITEVGGSIDSIPDDMIMQAGWDILFNYANGVAGDNYNVLVIIEEELVGVH